MGNYCSNSSLSSSGLELVADCSNSSLSQLKSYNLVWSVAGLASAVVTLIILVSLLIFKTYRTTLQRLFLYLTIFTLLDLANDSLNIMLRLRCFHEGVCRAVGYIDVCIFITSTLLLLGIGVYLLIVVYYHIQGHPLPKTNGFKVAIVEVAYLLIVIVVPPVVLWKSYSSFGMGGVYCWVERYSSSCNQTNSMYRQPVEIKILSTFTAIMAVNTAIFILLKVISCLLACRHKHIRSHHLRIAKRATLLVMFLMVYFIINLITLWAHYHITLEEKAQFPVMICVAVMLPSSQGLIPIGFLVYLNSRKKLKTTVKEKFSKLKKRLSLPRRSTELASAPLVTPSRPGCQDTPSYTVSREVGYTGAFTAVSSTYGSIDQTRNSE